MRDHVRNARVYCLRNDRIKQNVSDFLRFHKQTLPRMLCKMTGRDFRFVVISRAVDNDFWPYCPGESKHLLNGLLLEPLLERGRLLNCGEKRA